MKWLLVAAIVIPGTLGDVLQSLGMRRHGEVRQFGPRALGRMMATILRDPYILVGIGAMAVSFFALLALLSVAEVSFAVPATAASYIVETVLAKYILRERIGWRRWAGAALVAIGVGLLTLP